MNRFGLPVISFLALALALGGCSAFKKLTGKNDDTVLQGQREEVLEPSQTRSTADIKRRSSTAAPAPSQGVAQTTLENDLSAPCDPEIQSCPNDSESGAGGTGNGGIFGDGQ